MTDTPTETTPRNLIAFFRWGTNGPRLVIEHDYIGDQDARPDPREAVIALIERIKLGIESAQEMIDQAIEWLAKNPGEPE